MMVRTVLAGLLLAAALVACGPERGGREGSPATSAPATIESTAAPASPADAATPTETERPGPTVGAPRTPPSIGIVPAYPELPRFDRPIAMTEVPGEGVMLLATQEGRIFVFDRSSDAREAFVALDWRAKTRREGNEEGLLGLTLDPGFAERRWVYVYYTAADGPRRSVVSRLTATGSGTSLRIDPSSEVVLLEIEQPYSNHNGGQILFGPDGMLYVALGDGGGAGDPQGNGQNLSTLLGSILRLDVRTVPATAPPDNPFVGREGARPEIWAYGFRNPWRFSFDRETGDLWAGDVGQNAWEEIDLVRAGRNYGWNIMEGDACFRPPSGCERAGLEPPVVVYPTRDGNCAVTGGYVYRGEAYTPLRGFYLFGDYCSGRIWALDAEAATRGLAVGATLVADTDLSIASFAEDAAGELYVLAFDGRVYRVTVP